MNQPAGMRSGYSYSVSRFFRKAIEIWALAGGVVLLGVVLANAFSLFGNIMFHQPVPGDFEIVEVGVAIAVFAFLPYCQLTDANVTADIFTAGAGPRTVAVLSIIASLIALGFSVLLLWRMGLGLISYRRYEEVTMVFQFPIWIAYIPILISLVLLIIAAVITLTQGRNTSNATDAPSVAN
jgi:TRAP-type C4-dicarboxylate transport system permease small subunit